LGRVGEIAKGKERPILVRKIAKRNFFKSQEDGGVSRIRSEKIKIFSRRRIGEGGLGKDDLWGDPCVNEGIGSCVSTCNKMGESGGHQQKERVMMKGKKGLDGLEKGVNFCRRRERERTKDLGLEDGGGKKFTP